MRQHNFCTDAGWRIDDEPGAAAFEWLQARGMARRVEGFIQLAEQLPDDYDDPA